jgi:hypothetical protein
VAGRSGVNGGLARGVRTSRCFGARGPWEGASGPDAEDGTAQARRARAREARDVAFWRRNCFNVARFESEKLQKFE